MIKQKYSLCRQIFQDFSEIDVDVYMAGCQGELAFSLKCSCIKWKCLCCGLSFQPQWWNS